MEWSFQTLFDISPLQWHAVGTAIACGSVVGLERQLRGKPVGIRTSSLITLGTYIFLAVAMTFTSASVDQSRVIGQVITGIGFLGAGVMLARDGIVTGVTSAATIWVLASLGVMIGTGYESQAIKMALLTVAILAGIDFMEDRVKALTRGVHRHIRTESED